MNVQYFYIEFPRQRESTSARLDSRQICATMMGVVFACLGKNMRAEQSCRQTRTESAFAGSPQVEVPREILSSSSSRISAHQISLIPEQERSTGAVFASL
jgi:hypothetical protein